MKVWDTTMGILNLNYQTDVIAVFILNKDNVVVNDCIAFHGVDIPSAGVPYLNVMRWGSSKILDMIV